MRKNQHDRYAGPLLSRKRNLKLSTETIRALTEQELPLVAGGCPTGSWPSATSGTSQQTDSGTVC